MRIVFICSSLEAGRDGVGDYSRLLAAELIRQGHSPAIIALNDRFVTNLETGSQPSGDMEIPVLRVPRGVFKTDISGITQWIDDFNPEWLSLQFVAFGFQPKGLPYGLAKQLRLLTGNRKWHIMFHELWVGIAREESKKFHLWGFLQQGIIRSILRKLKPAAIHTQTPLYQLLLRKMGYKAGLLPLFGNIPVTGKRDEAAANDKKSIRLIMFALIHPGAPAEAFAVEAAAYARTKDIAISLTFAGNCGAEQERWVNAWQAQNLQYVVLGEQPAARISEILLNSTMGISTTSLAKIEKSGSVAAMQQHGLPVLSVAAPWTPVGVAELEIPAGVIKYQPGDFVNCMEGTVSQPVESNPSIVASALITSLSSVN